MHQTSVDNAIEDFYIQNSHTDTNQQPGMTAYTLQMHPKWQLNFAVQTTPAPDNLLAMLRAEFVKSRSRYYYNYIDFYRRGLEHLI